MFALPIRLLAGIAAAVIAAGGSYQLLKTGVEGFVNPLPHTLERETPLHFGLYVTPDPENNPIDPPERFIGFHTATDFEILEGEENEEVPVYAVCTGKILQATTAEGYGGVMIQQCSLNGEWITVLYGHVNPDRMAKAGIRAKAGDKIAILADADSAGSGFTRKHLHLGMHKGRDIVLLGYVQTEAELDRFIDPQTVLPGIKGL